MVKTYSTVVLVLNNTSLISHSMNCIVLRCYYFHLLLLLSSLWVVCHLSEEVASLLIRVILCVEHGKLESIDISQ